MTAPPTSRDTAIGRIFAAQLLSQMGDKLMLVGIAWVISERYSSSFVPWFVGAGALPHLLSLTFAAAGIARLGGPLRTVVFTDALRGVAFVVGAFGAARLSGDGLLGLLFSLGLLTGFLGALFNPAVLSLPPVFAAGDPVFLQKSTALIESCFSISAVVAPLLSTLLYKWTGLTGLLLINGLSYLAAAGLEVTIRLPAPGTAAGTPGEGPGAGPAGARPEVSPWQPLREQPALLKMLAGFFCMNLFLGPILAFLPLFAKSVYGGSIGTLAWLEGSLGAGTAIGALGLSLLPLRGSARTKVTVSVAGVAVSYLGFALSRQVWTGAAAVGMLGLFLSVANIVLLNLFQSRPRPEAVPVIMSWVNLISVASLPISMAGVGFFLAGCPVTSVAQVCAGILAGLAIVAAAFGGLLNNWR